MGRYITRCFLGSQVVHCWRQKWKNPVESLSHLVIYSVLFLGLNFFLSHQKIKESTFNPLGICSVFNMAPPVFLWANFYFIFLQFSCHKNVWIQKKKKKFESRALKFPIHHFVSCFLYFFLHSRNKQENSPICLSHSGRGCRGWEAASALNLATPGPVVAWASKRNHHFLPPPQYQLHRQLGCLKI